MIGWLWVLWLFFGFGVSLWCCFVALGFLGVFLWVWFFIGFFVGLGFLREGEASKPLNTFRRTFQCKFLKMPLKCVQPDL